MILRTIILKYFSRYPLISPDQTTKSHLGEIRALEKSKKKSAFRNKIVENFSW